MAVEAVQSNQQKSHQASYIKSAVAGGLGGYALKYVLPLTPQEKDEKFFNDINGVKEILKTKEINEIRKSPLRTDAQDEFVKLIDNNEIKFSKFSGKTGLIEFLSHFNMRAREAAKKIVTTYNKDIRPANSFIAIGAGFALATAFVYNVLGKMQE